MFAGDIRDSHGVSEAMRGCDFVLHLAALIAIPYSYHSPDTYVDTNVKGTLNIVQAARDQGIQRVLHTSTSEVYGTARFVPISEEHPLTPQSPYSATKIAADQIALSFWHAFSTPVVSSGPSTPMARGSRRAQSSLPSSPRLPVGSGNCVSGSQRPTRDFSFVQDTVGGFIAALESDQGSGEVVNLGSGFEISIADTVALIAELMQVEVQVSEDQDRLRPDASEVYRLFADNSKAKRIFGWEPRYAQLEGFRRGLSETIPWFVNPENLNEYKPDRYNI